MSLAELAATWGSATGALVSSGFAYLVWRQAKRHFTVTRTYYWLDRFNSLEFQQSRRTIESWSAALPDENPDRSDRVREFIARVRDGHTSSCERETHFRILGNTWYLIGLDYFNKTIDQTMLRNALAGPCKRDWKYFQDYARELRVELQAPFMWDAFERLAIAFEQGSHPTFAAWAKSTDSNEARQ